MRVLHVLLPATALWLATATPSQVVISEINFSPAQTSTQWIELLNLGSSRTDLSTWSLYYATQTPGAPGNYWFGFPAGTTIDAGQFLRVHWLAPVQPSTSTDIYTGSTVFHFLFGYYPEPLQKVSGAVALLNTNQNALMNMPGIVEDWVSWGSSGAPREALAVMNGKWTAGDFVSSPLFDDSIALDYDLNAEPTPSSAFFHDATPTTFPEPYNHPNALSENYGSNCAVGNATPPQLVATSIPTQGNRDFRLVVQGTSSSQTIYLLLSPAQGNGMTQLGPCPVWIDVTMPVVSVGVPGQPGSTMLPVSLLDPNLAGGSVYMQAAAFEGLADYGLSDGLHINIGA